MNNISNEQWSEAKVFHSTDCEIYSVKDLLASDDKALLRKIESIGESKGRYVNFKVGEVIQYPPVELGEIYLDGFYISNGEKRLALSCKAYTEKLGFFACPMAIWRRMPLQTKLEGQDISEYDELTTNNQLGEKLIMAKNDFVRVQMLAGKSQEITDKFTGHRFNYEYDKETGISHRTNDLVPLLCYKSKES